MTVQGLAEDPTGTPCDCGIPRLHTDLPCPLFRRVGKSMAKRRGSRRRPQFGPGSGGLMSQSRPTPERKGWNV